MNNEAVLEANGITCIRDDRILFEKLSFSLKPGQILLLEGKNGSGKTSLLRILCGFREPDEGQVLWCGESIKDSQYRLDMAYVGHLDGIKKELTVIENLRVCLALSQPGSHSIPSALQKVELEGFDDVLVQVLSAGQKRRLSLARLLITRNRLWILDEPFTSIDRQGIALIESLMVDYCSAGGVMVLTSHHDIELHGLSIHRVNLS
jgi:heme exporter protein A